jgi:two-component system, NarL family, response regulator NreC
LRLKLEQNQHFEVVGEAADGREAVRLANELKPDLAIVDIGMPVLNGIEATVQIVRRNPRIGVIILSMHADETYLVRTLTAGAKGYLLKDTAQEDLHRAVQTVAQGKPFFSPAIAKIMLEDYMRQLQQRGLQDPTTFLQIGKRRSCSSWRKVNPTKRSRRSCMSAPIRSRPIVRT